MGREVGGKKRDEACKEGWMRPLDRFRMRIENIVALVALAVGVITNSFLLYACLLITLKAARADC